MANYFYAIRDNSDEIGRLTIPVEEPTEAELDWETIINANEGNFRTALDGVILGNIAAHHVLVSNESPNDVRPASQWAQREFAMRVFLVGNTSGEKRNITVPTVDLDALDVQDGSDLVNLADAGVMAAFVAQLEAVYLVDDEAYTVERAVIVGRNS